MNKFPNLKDPFHFVATLGGIGMLPKAPGTFGSIAAWVIFVYLSHFISIINMLILTILFFILSIWICNNASKDLENKDHKSIVIVNKYFKNGIIYIYFRISTIRTGNVQIGLFFEIKVINKPPFTF